MRVVFTWNSKNAVWRTYRIAVGLGAAVQPHGGASVEGDQTAVERLQRIVLEERMIFGHVTEVDGKL